LDFFFFDVDIEETFTIGFFKLPPPVYLAGSTSEPQLPGGAVDTDGKLYLNIGSRAYLRDLEEAEYDETVYVSHVPSTGSTEIVQVSCFGRSQKFSGVTRIIANGGSGNDMIVINEGVESSVDLRGGTGNDVIVHQGKGSGTNNVIRGDDGDDYLELGSALLVNVALYGGGHNDYIQGGPKDDVIYGNGGDDQILGSGGNDTIYGNEGSDMITGGSGLDNLYGHGGPDVFYWTWGDGQDSIINGGSGSDTLVIIADDDGEDIVVSRNASDIVITWTSESPELALTGVSIEGLDINLASGSDTFTLEDILGSGVTRIDLDLGDYETNDSVADTVLLKGSSGNDSFVLDSAGGLVNVSRVGVVDVIISNAVRTPGNEDELIIRTYEGSDTINAAAAVEDLMAMELVTGDDDDILIGSPYDDILDSGTGSDIVTGGRGIDIFRDDSGDDDTDTLIEILDYDMSLFNNLFVVGTIMADNGTSAFFKSSIIDEQNATPPDPLFPAPVVFPLQDTGDVFAAGAEVETLIYNGEPIFERAYLTGGNSNNLIVIGDFDNSITVDGATLAVTPWTGEAILDNGANSSGTGVNKNEYYILNLNGSSGARISILDTGGAEGYDELYIVCTDQDDKVSLNTIRSGGEVTGVVIVGEPYGSGFVQKMTVVNGQELPVYYEVDANGDKIQRTDGDGNLIYDLTDPENPDPIYLETTTITPFPVMVREANSDRDDVSFRNVERVTIMALGGMDTLISDDTAVPMVVNLGSGDDTVIIGSVPQINDPGNITLDYPLGIPIADTENMTNGNSAVMTIYGEDGDDEFEVNHNTAKLYLHGGADDDTFVINTFLTLADQNNPDDIANLSTLFGGTGTDRYEYLQNAPVNISGGTGTDTIVINGTPIRDVFIITELYVAGAGRIVNFTQIEKIEVNAGGGSDLIYVLSSDPNLEVTIRGGSGDDTIHLGGDPPTLLFNPPAYTYQPPSYQVQDPPETVYETITWNIGWTTLSFDWNWWSYNFTQTDANNAVRNYINALVNVMRFFIPGLELTTNVDDIVAQSNIHYSYGYGRWWIFDREVYVTFNPPAFDLQYPTQALPPPRTVVPDPITTDPLPFAFKADTTFDLAGILGKVFINGGETLETNGDKVVVHNLDSAAVTGTLTDFSLTGLGLGQGMEYKNFEEMIILLGDHNDVLNINDTLAGPLTISLGGGADTANVEKISGKTTILGSAGNDTINVASNSESLEDILYNLIVKGDTGFTETVTQVAYEPDKHDSIQNQVYIDTAPTVDANGNITAYAEEEKARIIFEKNGKVWVYVVVIDPATGMIIEDLIQERDSSGNLLWRDADGNKTTTYPGTYTPSLIPVNRTVAVPQVRSQIETTSGEGNDTLNVYDSANSADVTAILTGSTLAVTSMPGLLKYDLNELDAVPIGDVLNIFLGSDDDVFNVQGTSVVTNLILNGGDERIYVSDSAALDLDTETDFLTGNLNEINGILNIDAGSGRHLLMLSDESATEGDSNVLITDQAVAGLPGADIIITGLAPAAITYTADPVDGNFTEGITIWTGPGDDTISIDGTHRRDTQDTSGNDIRTITTLNTGQGQDTVYVSLDAATDGFFVLNTQQDSDVVDASTSTLGFIIFGGDGAFDEITGSEGDDVIFGDRGYVYYRDLLGIIVTEIGNGGPGDTTDGVAHTDRYEEAVDFLTGGVDHIFGGGGNDLIFGEIDDDLILGGSGNDTIFGYEGDDWIKGQAGDDLMAGGDGDDIMEGGAGNDVMAGDNCLFGSVILTGGAGDDYMMGGSGDDEMYGQGGHDQMWGNEDDDTMLGGDGTDWMFGNEDDDHIYGEEGDDILCGDSGVVTLTGSEVSMVQTIYPGVGGDDTIEGNDGEDMIFGGAGNDDIWGHAGNDVILGDCGKITLSGGVIELIETSDPAVGGDDTMEGNEGDDIILGGAANDEIWGNAGKDIILGDNGRLDYVVDADPSTLDLITTTDPTLGGSDTISCGTENDLAFGGTAGDTIYGNEGNDLLFGDHGKVERVVGSTIDLATVPVPSFTFTSIFTGAGDGGGDDIMEGNTGDDILIGGQGDDDMYGGEDDDDMIGGHNIPGGIDELDSSQDPNDRMDGGSGDDAMAGDNAEILRRTDPVSPRMRTLNGTILYDGEDISDVNTTHQANPSGAVGRDITLYDHNDSPTPDTFGSDYMAGGSDEDVMFGQLGDDVIQGDASSVEEVSSTDPSVEGVEDGDDYIEGNGGSDLIFGNLGQDDIIGGSSVLFGLTFSDFRPDDSDTIFGGAGTDTSRNNLGDTSETGHAQDSDMILGDNGNIYRLVGTNGMGAGAFLTFNYDNYSGEEGLKIIPRVAELIDYTPGGLDYLPTSGQAAEDIGAADEIHGESGDDFCYGMVGNDILFGEGQDDDLIGGYGHDWISGGTGQDGILGDEGRIYTSRNGTEEPLYGIDDLSGDLNDYISSPGKVQQAIINVEDELKKTVNLTPFKLGDPNDMDYSHRNFDPQYADDIIYGGWGKDFLHGGDGDDAISGAEALEDSAVLVFEEYDYPDPNRQGTVVTSSYSEPYNPGNVLGFEAYRAGEFALYDEYNPRGKIFLGTGYDFLLNFNAWEIDENGTPADNNDGDDVIFGDLGNDWLVGGTGRDHLYGGYGSDLLNCDDDLETNGGFNDAPDTDPSYEDFAYGGAGRDVLMANTGGDRLTDWAGEFNSYIVPYAPFGFFAISRAPQPQLMQFLYDLSESDGADPTRPSDTGADPARNGEPEGELGLVMQQDFGWRNQTGAPDDPQPGNIPGGSRDVLRSASFNDGTMEAFAPDSGVWEVNGGSLKVSAESIGGDAASVFHVGDMLPLYYEIQASINADKPTGGWKSNAYVIFDYHSPTDFKFAGINISKDKIQMGHRTPDGWIVDVQKSCQLKPNQNYNMLVAINGTVVTVVVDGTEAFYHIYDPRIIEGFSYGLNQGMVGVGSDNSRGTFDNIAVQVLPPQYTLDVTEDFSDGFDDIVFNPVTGEWQIGSSRYEGTPAPDPAFSLVDLGLGRGLEANAILELEATFSSQTSGGFVFDYYGPEDYKFVIMHPDMDQVVIGHHTSKNGLVYDVVIEKTLRAGIDYTLFVTLKGATMSICIDGYMVWGHVFNAITVDGEFGLMAMEGANSFDEVTVRTDDSAFKE
jgi:Ca2+-binding RTX toxin-like protein